MRADLVNAITPFVRDYVLNQSIDSVEFISDSLDVIVRLKNGISITATLKEFDNSGVKK